MRTAILLTILFLAACAPAAENQEVPPTQQEPAEPAEPLPPPEPVEEPEPAEAAKQTDPEVEELFEKLDKVKGYSFQLAALPDITGDRYYWVRGNKAKIELVSPLQMDGWSADYVFIDYDTNTATAYCLKYRGCKLDKEKDSVSFEEYSLKLPLHWVEDAKYGEKVTSLLYNNRQVDVVRWQDGGLYYEAYLDTFYGVPQRVAAALDMEITQIVGGFEYQTMAINNVKEEDVTPPY